MKKAGYDLLRNYLTTLKKETAVLDMDQYIQHGDTTCYWHSVAVAHYSVCLIRRLGIRCDMESLIVGALLHDYFLYDWHINDKSHKLHGFSHPKRAFINAQRDWKLTARERDIIRKHMFPLTLIPPIYKESMIVCMVDKFCATKEMLQKEPYSKLKRQYGE